MRTGLVLGGVILLGSLGCSGPADSTGSSSPSGSVTATSTTSADRAAESQHTLDALLAAARADRRAAFDDQLSDPTSAFADRLFGNLTTLPPTAVQFRAQPRTADLSATERARWPTGWAQQVEVASRVGHDTGPSTYRVWFVFTAVAGRIELAATADGPAADPPSRPLWLTEPLRMISGPDVTVLAGGDRADLTGWLRRAESAEHAVRARIGGLGTAAGGSAARRGLVIELPSTEQAFDQTLGVAAGSYDQIAAVAWPEGPDPATSAVRVVINPGPAGALDEERLGVLIIHEATHVLTGSTTSPAPMWLVEGFADWVAFNRLPAAAPPTRDEVLADVRKHGVPTAFPSDSDFRPDAADLDLTYGRAWMLCSFVAGTWSDADLVKLYGAVDGGAPLAAAAPEVLGVDESTLLHRWQAWLTALSRR